MRYKALIPALVCMVCLGGLSSAQSSQSFQKNDFSISLPNGWVEIPKDALEVLEKEASKANLGGKAPHYDCGFQLDESQNWLDLPYLLVQVNSQGRISESELKKLELEESKQMMLEAGKSLSSILSDVQMGKVHYDKQAKIGWFRMDMTRADTKVVSMMSGLIPTEKGYIQVHAYSLKTDFSTYEAIFENVIRSVKPEPAIIYKSQWADDIPVVGGINWGKVLVAALVGGIVSLLGSGWAFLRKKLERTSSRPDGE